MYIYYIIVGGMFAMYGHLCRNPPLLSMHDRVQLYQVGPFYASCTPVSRLMGIICKTDDALYHRRPFVQIRFCYKI